MKDLKKVTQGKKNRASGATFELRVRKDMTEKGWVVDKFGLNVEFENIEVMKVNGEKAMDLKKGKLIQAKNKWAGFNRPMMMGAGFPDFVCFRRIKMIDDAEVKEISLMSDGSFDPAFIIKKSHYGDYQVIGVECKVNGILTKLEKQKCKWLLDNNVFSKILIASKTKVKNRVVIVYKEFDTNTYKLQ